MIDVTPQWVVKQWLDIAKADPNELVYVKRINCRYCHGLNHRYQWTASEYSAAVSRAIDNVTPIPDGAGGFGFDPCREPHAECPECQGHGHESLIVADTRKISSPLYAGAERTKYGIKVHMRDRDAALTNLARYLGMLNNDKNIPPNQPTGKNINVEDLSDDQLLSIINGSFDEK